MVEEVEDLVDVMLLVMLAPAAVLINVRFVQKAKRKHRV